MKITTITTTLVSMAAFTLAAHADSITANPGMWSHQNTMTLMMNGQPMPMPGRSTTRTECLTPDKATFDPNKMAEDGCTVSNVKSSSLEMSFTVTCSGDGPPMSGDMVFKLAPDRNSGSGSVTMQGNVEGMGAINATMNMTSKRIGDC